jgi:hypothetical protein
MAKVRMTNRRKHVDRLETRLWGVFDVAGRRPLRGSTARNAATDFILECVLQSTLELPSALSGFIAVEGECSHLRTAFPEQLRTQVSEQVERIVRALASQSDNALGDAEGVGYCFCLSLHASAADALKWAEDQWTSRVANGKTLARESEICDKPFERTEGGVISLPDMEEIVDAFVNELPDDPTACLATVSQLYASLRAKLATKLGDSIGKALVGVENLSYENKASLAKEINGVLADTRLAIEDPNTKLPATLLAHRPKATSPTSYMRIWDSHKAPDGRRHYVKVGDLRGLEGEIRLIGESGPSPSRSR